MKKRGKESSWNQTAMGWKENEQGEIGKERMEKRRARQKEKRKTKLMLGG